MSAPSPLGGLPAADEPQAIPTGTSVDCPVIYETVDGVYVGVGTGAGLKEGQTGQLYHDGQPVGRIKVTNVASTEVACRGVITFSLATLPLRTGSR